MTRTRSLATRTLALALLVLASLTGSVAAGQRDTNVEILESVSGVRDPARFEVWLNQERSAAREGKRVSLVVGQAQHYHILSADERYLVAIHINAHGVATILFPSASGEGNLVQGKTRRDLPSDPVQVEPPLGEDDLFVFATKQPLTRGALGLGDLKGDYPLIDAEEFPELASKLQATLNALPSGSVMKARVRSVVFGVSQEGTRGLRNVMPAYSVEDIVKYFTELRTRGLKRPRLDAQIHFDPNQTVLTDQARANLDVFGEALNHAGLIGFSFVLGGHTDSDGSEKDNDDLSQRRADAVREYLIAKHKVKSARLETKAYGEGEPLRGDDSEKSKAMNRRVEFRLTGP